jgi:replicative DNA helicase
MSKQAPVKRIQLSEQREAAERGLIISLVVYKPTRSEMDELLSLCPADACKHIDYAPFWQAAAKIHAAGHEVNGVTLFDAMKASYTGNLAAELSGYMSHQYIEGTVEYYAQRVAEIGRLEELQYTLEQYAGRVCDAFAESDVIAAEIQNSLQKYGTADEAMPTLDTLITGIVANVERGTAAKPLPSPWPTLNNVLKGGIAPGELAVLAARPGMGKTALAGCWALEIARAFGPVLFISCEVKDSTIGSRLLAREGKIDNRAFREGLGMSQLQISNIRDAAEALRNIPLHIVDTSRQAITPMQVRRLARKIHGGPRMVVVDYLQLMYPDTKHDSREREIADMSRSMKRLAVELNCPVLLLSQLNRKVEEGNREPQLSDLRESGAVEQDADIVIMLHADKKELNSADVLMQALVRKGRSSGTGAAGLIFHKAYSDFSEGTYVKREKQAKEFDL